MGRVTGRAGIPGVWPRRKEVCIDSRALFRLVGLGENVHQEREVTVKIHRFALVFVLLLCCTLVTAPVSGAAPGDYIVAAGDTLYRIAAKLLGDGSRYLEIVELTNSRSDSDSSYAFIENPDSIEIGWKLAISDGAAALRGATVLVEASPYGASNGIMFDSRDRLHMASVGGGILRIDTETGEILEWLDREQGVDGPDDLTFGPDGSIYWTSLVSGKVGRLSPDGTLTTQAVSPGVNPITFSDDGRLFVALDFFGDGLYELDPDLAEPPRLIIEELGWLNGMDWGPDGYLYGPIWTQARVVRIDVDAATVTTVADGFGVPAAVKFDSRGRLHVVDNATGKLWRVNVETGSKELVAQLPLHLDNLAFDSQDHLFVSNAGDASVVEVMADGRVRTVRPSRMTYPGGVAVVPREDGGESVYVADVFTLREIDGLTGEERRMPSATAMTVAVDDDHLLVSSWFANVVEVWDPETETVLGAMPDFAVPLNAIRFRGDYVVAELMTASVVLAPEKDPSPSQRVTLASGLGIPIGLAKTDDDLFVSDWATGMVLQIISDGEVLSEPTVVATGLKAPEGLAVDLNGDLLVVETGTGRLLRIDLGTGQVSTVAEGLEAGRAPPEGAIPTWVLAGVAVGPSGAIYVVSGTSVYRIEPGS